MATHHLVALLLGALAIGVAVGVGAVWVGRLHILRRRQGSFRCQVAAAPDGPWRPGLAQYSADALSWWPRLSLGGAERWRRTDLMVLERRPTRLKDSTGQPLLAIACGVTRGAEAVPELYLMLDPASSAGLTSWLEAASRDQGVVI
ncbi:MAG: DUF2550 domain-containing protein [Actinobacteria bacterium]|nr:DUF2550 domain-containing protein [Actinomycetota bacterium]MCG2800347.1 DUF2550 domain-containing protein [Cellulomonas sp.]